MSIAAHNPDARSVTLIAGDETVLPALERIALGAGATIADRGLASDADWELRPFGDVVLLDLRGMTMDEAAPA